MSESTSLQQRQEQAYERLKRISSLPLQEQGVCACIAAEMSLSVWQQWEDEHNVPPLGKRLIDCYQGWLKEETSGSELEACGNAFDAVLPEELRAIADPSVAMAGTALRSVPMIALDQCGEAHDDYVWGAIFFAAGAVCHTRHAIRGNDYHELTEPELDFIDRWWRRCGERVPDLAVEN